jgi:hypothetical protein
MKQCTKVRTNGAEILVPLLQASLPCSSNEGYGLKMLEGRSSSSFDSSLLSDGEGMSLCSKNERL